MLGALCGTWHPKSRTDVENTAGPEVPEGERITAAEVQKTSPWTFSMGYRFQPSSRHFVGTVEQVQREITGNQIQNTYHLFDFAIERQLSSRFSVTASLPVVLAYRNQLYAPKGEYRVRGIGDMTAGVRGWVLKPSSERRGNIAFGVSLKMPTGKPDSTGAALDSKNNPIIATADQSIQLGDGGWGFALDSQAYIHLKWGFMAYETGSYLFNPRDTNGVASFRTRPLEAVFSVSDQYLARGGIARAVPKVPGLIITFGGRMEGVPVRDLLGKSNGFRRPGYAISGDPGFMYTRWGYVFSVNVPWAIERNRRTSVTDYQAHIHGDAAFADYAVNLGFSKRF